MFASSEQFKPEYENDPRLLAYYAEAWPGRAGARAIASRPATGVLSARGIKIGCHALSAPETTLTRSAMGRYSPLKRFWSASISTVAAAAASARAPSCRTR